MDVVKTELNHTVTHLLQTSSLKWKRIFCCQYFWMKWNAKSWWVDTWALFLKSCLSSWQWHKCAINVSALCDTVINDASLGSCKEILG